MSKYARIDRDNGHVEIVDAQHVRLALAGYYYNPGMAVPVLDRAVVMRPPQMSEPGQCRSCGAPILWVKTESGRRMPLDLDPLEDGSIVVRMGPGVKQATAHIESSEETEARLKAKDPAARTAYVSHFASCPEEAKWRRKRPGSSKRRTS